LEAQTPGSGSRERSFSYNAVFVHQNLKRVGCR
jgi:hypothetical protein